MRGQASKVKSTCRMDELEVVSQLLPPSTKTTQQPQAILRAGEAQLMTHTVKVSKSGAEIVTAPKACDISPIKLPIAFLLSRPLLKMSTRVESTWIRSPNSITARDRNL